MADSLGGLLRRAVAALREAGKPDAALDARLIVEHVTGAGRAELILDPQRPVAPADVEAVLSAVARRCSGEPVHRILGHREFHGLRLALSSATLEPRSDTEALVGLALPHVRGFAARQGECRILDLGTGTGAVALALLVEEPRAVAVGSDISREALATAASNADMAKCTGRFATVRSDWFAAIEGRFHVIVSNPPYIASREIDALEREVREHDPLAALDGGPDGLAAYRAIAAGAASHLEPGGVVAVEIGHDQVATATAIFESAGFAAIGNASDLGGHARALAFGAAKP